MKITKKGNVVLKLEEAHIVDNRLDIVGRKGRIVSFQVSEIMELFGVTRKQIEGANWEDFLPGRFVQWQDVVTMYCKEHIIRKGVAISE